MTRKALALGALLVLPAFGCGGDGGTDAPDTRPFRDDWQQEYMGEFLQITGEGDEAVVNIGSITIGGTLEGGSDRENYANRGDVIVKFDGPADTILVEFRRFTFATNEDSANDDFAAISLWAYANQTRPAPPAEQDAEDRCDVDSGWQNGCEIRLYYDGLKQLARAGTDIRVTLPPDYVRGVDVVTEDSVGDSDYFNRGNVCIDGTPGTVDVQLESGIAYVELADDIQEMPTCPENLVAGCESWPCQPGEDSCMVGDETFTAGAQAWANECGCINQGYEFGRVKVEAPDPGSADITIDVPEGLWASITARNEAMGQNLQGEFCEAMVGVPGYETLEGAGNDFPWETRGVVNKPSDVAVAGAGYSVQAFSGDCAPVASTEDPSAYVGPGNGPMQESQERGNLTICTGCLAERACDDLLP